jgi:CRP/FNR family cyclic AMP-dependent transcriptional regulator
MEIRPLHQFPRESLDALVAAIPFYRAVKQQDQWQYDLLMSHSRVIEYGPGEVLLEKGETDNWLYFLLKGQLMVTVGDDQQGERQVNYIIPGEVFGDLAVFLNHERSATVVADHNCKKATVFGTDFRVFGDLREIHQISLKTKLLYYSNMVHNLRWKLEVYRVTYPDHVFASQHRKIKLYTGPKGTMEELISLDEQARQLAKLLVDWNLEFDRLASSPRESLDGQSLAALE